MKPLNFKLLGVAILLVTSATFSQSYVKDFGNDFLVNTSNGYNHDYKSIDKSFVGFVMAGVHSFAPSSSSSDMVLVDYNTTTNSIQTSKRYVIPGKQQEVSVLKVLGVTKGGSGFLTVGVTGAFSGPPMFDQQSSYLIKTNLNGDIAWSKKLEVLNINGQYGPVRIHDMIQLSDRSAVLVGYVANLTTGNGTVWKPIIVRLNPQTGQLFWTSTFNSQVSFVRAVEKSNGNIVVVSNSYTASSQLVEFNRLNGSIVNSKTIQYANNNLKISAITVNSNNDFVIAGTWINTGSDAWAIGIVDNGLNTISSLTGVQNKMTLYYSHVSQTELGLLNNIHVTDDKIKVTALANYLPSLLTTDLTGNIISFQTADANFYTFTRKGRNSFLDGNAVTALYKYDNQPFRVYSYDDYDNVCNETTLPIFLSSIDVEFDEEGLTRESPSVSFFPFEVEVEDFFPDDVYACSPCTTPPLSSPITTNTGGTVLCSVNGSSLTLSATAGFTTYQWEHDGSIIVGANGQQLDVNQSGTYTVVLTDEYGCTTSESIFITVYSGFNIKGGPDDVEYCKHGPPSNVGWISDPLISYNGPYSYSWVYNGNSQTYNSYSIPYLGDGTYAVTVSTPCGSQFFSFEVEQCCPPDPEFQYFIDHNGLNVLNYPANISTYDSEIFEILESCDGGITWTQVFYGTYTGGFSGTITVPYSPNCSYQINHFVNSDCLMQGFPYSVTIPSNVKLAISPNPNEGKFNLSISSTENTLVNYSIMDISGKLLMKFTSRGKVESVDLSNYSPGIYLVTVEINGERLTKRVIVN